MTTAKRLKDQLKSITKISIDEIGEAMGMSRQNIYIHLINAEEKGQLNYEFGLKLKDKFGLVYQDGNFTLQNTPHVEEPINAFRPYNARHVDLQTGKANLTLVPLKAYGGFVTGYAHRVFLDSLEQITFPWIKGPCVGFEVEGISMYKKGDEDSLKPGDTVVCTELMDETWLTKGKIHVFVTVDGIIVKLFDRVQDGLYHLYSANEDFNPVKPIPVKEVKRTYMKEYILKK
jgi:hypothetical protein